MEQVSVLTLNVWNREGPYPARLELLRRWIHELQPDVIGLQEVVEGQTEELLEGTGMQHTWVGTELSGIAIAARWQLDDPVERQLPGAEGQQAGGIALGAHVQTPAGSLPFVCATSFYPMPFDGWKREQQMPALVDLVRDVGRQQKLPAVLVGDFNAEPESNEIRFLKGLHSIGSRGAYFCDAWQRAGTGSDGATWTERNAYSGPWGLPNRRIDYIFVAAPGVVGPGAVRSCRVVCDEEVNGVWPSDHFGVSAILSTA
ncbi:MAG: endonuclease/exonuclease/phosphatase family protein [Myxococcales bacterium]|nr:endonuclease/exonuclease/phosphatase family protein [Myxococcales bacterium]